MTGAGELLATRAQRIVSELQEARDAVRDFDAAPRGVLRCTAPVAFGRVHVAPASLAFLERHADISVEFGLTDRVVDLVEEGVDVASASAVCPIRPCWRGAWRPCAGTSTPRPAT